MNKKTLGLTILTAALLSVLIFSFASAISAGDPACVIILAIKDALLGVGAILVIVGWLVAGILYLTSAGSQTRMGIAKAAMIAAIIGTLLVIIAPTAYNFINQVTGSQGSASGDCG